MYLRATAAVSAIGMALFSGCGGAERGQVSGKVTFQGNPVAGATVTFSPAGGGKLGTAMTQDDGSFTVTEAGAEDALGILPGNYSVAISAMEEAAETQVAADDSLGSIALSQSSSANRNRSLLPLKYASPRTSGLSFEVKAGEQNQADFELGE